MNITNSKCIILLLTEDSSQNNLYYNMKVAFSYTSYFIVSEYISTENYSSDKWWRSSIVYDSGYKWLLQNTIGVWVGFSSCNWSSQSFYLSQMLKNKFILLIVEVEMQSKFVMKEYFIVN